MNYDAKLDATYALIATGQTAGGTVVEHDRGERCAFARNLKEEEKANPSMPKLSVTPYERH